MNQTEQLAQYLADRMTTWPRDLVPRGYPRYDAGLRAPRPSAAQLAGEFFQDLEFRALGLGNWLGGDQGQVIAEAIELVSPPFLRSDERLLQQALAIAVAEQAAGKRCAGVIALAGVSAFIVLLWSAATK